MTIFSYSDSTRVTVGVHNLSTTDTLLVDAVPQSMVKTLDSLRVSCDGTATTFSLWVTNKAGTVFYLVNAMQIAANDVYSIANHHVSLKEGWTMKCKAGADNHLDVTAVIMESAINKGRTAQ